MTFTVAKAYKILIRETTTIPAIAWLWKACTQLKHKFFFWLLINNMLNTTELLRRKNFFIQDYRCVMCDEYVLETRDRLFFHCDFAQICWKYVCPKWSPLCRRDSGSAY
uniref:Reverse transcriptase zinc-binding domain-containing protein n=1 Tax=Aegilops tauschii subsp. strangulata TaxID=200361 RepID=A0A452ZH53_AEGTS